MMLVKVVVVYLVRVVMHDLTEEERETVSHICVKHFD